MKILKLLWMLMLACMVSFCVAGCTSKDDDDDDETYQTRDYIIGIGKWNAQQVKKSDGTWSDFPFGEGKYFMIEFFDRKGDSSERKFKSWEYIGYTDPSVEPDQYEGTYTVSGRTVTCSVDGQQHLKMIVTSMENRQLAATVTFYKKNVTFDVIMERTW